MGERIIRFIKSIKQKKKMMLTFIICITLIIGIIFSEFMGKTKNKTNEQVGNNNYIDYTKNLETKLESIISSIYGAGECKIMITLETGEENIYARQIKNQNEDKSEFSKSVDEYEYVILKSSSSKEDGMLLKVVEPNIRGVAIVCQGGDDPQIKENIISAVSAVLDIKTNKISITKMK